jgi:methyl-accepting chemotaxis protein
MTKRQEALEAMSNMLQGNPELWAVAGDLFVKHMDWPGAEEMSKRLAKTIDPKLLQDDEDPAVQAAQQQMQAMAQEMEQMHAMLKNVNQSFEAQQLANDKFKADLQAYDAETKRLTALSGAAAAAPVSADIQLVVKQYIREILAEGLPEDAEPPSIEDGEMEVARPPQPTQQPTMS